MSSPRGTKRTLLSTATPDTATNDNSHKKSKRSQRNKVDDTALPSSSSSSSLSPAGSGPGSGDASASSTASASVSFPVTDPYLTHIIYGTSDEAMLDYYNAINSITGETNITVFLEIRKNMTPLSGADLIVELTKIGLIKNGMYKEKGWSPKQLELLVRFLRGRTCIEIVQTDGSWGTVKKMFKYLDKRREENKDVTLQS